MINIVISSFQTFNELLTAGTAITAFSLLVYAFTFNLRDRVARSFAIILICVVGVYVGKTIGSTTSTVPQVEFWLRFQWVGVIFLPAAYLHFSDALLATTGHPSRGVLRLATRLTYLVSLVFLLALPSSLLVGPLVQNVEPAPHLQRTWLTLIFTIYYIAGMIWSWVNFWHALQRTVTSTSRRRMQYLLASALSPALGSYPYLIFGYGIAAAHPVLFWLIVSISNIMVYVLLILMAYSVAFFGVPWPDRVVKRRLFKWLMRGPVAALVVLATTTIVRRTGVALGFSYTAAVPVTMVASILIFEHLITLVAPLWERVLFLGGDRTNMQLLHTLEERLLTLGDLRQFLESILAALCDRLQVNQAFIVTLGSNGMEMVITAGRQNFLEKELSPELLQLVNQNGFNEGLFNWGDYWLVPLFDIQEEQKLLGLLGIIHKEDQRLDPDQREAISLLSHRAGLALEDRYRQQQLISSLETLTPQVDEIQRLRAASRYDSASVFSSEGTIEHQDVSRWVKEALSHYWGGPKLTQSPLLKLQVFKQALEEHDGNPANAVRAILNQAIEQTKPEGERRFTGEWILYNILEMKFLEGRKVREVARRLAISDADLYRKQRVAIEAVAAAIVEMEQKAIEEDEENENVIHQST